MKISSRLSSCACCAVLLFGAVERSSADVTATVNPGANWLGYMNVFELPANGGGYVFGSGWGVNDLNSSFAGGVLTLSPNTIPDAAAFWYIGGGGPGAAGNKIMEANLYQEINGTWAGQTVTFSGNIVANSLTSAHTAIAFIKDFAPDYSSFVATTVPLTPGGFSFSLNSINDPARHIQFGFQMTGVNVWATDVASFGSVQISTVPEPSAGLLVAMGLAGLVFRKRTGQLTASTSAASF